MPLRCDDGAMPSFKGESWRDASSGGAMPSSPWRLGVKLVKLLQGGGDLCCEGVEHNLVKMLHVRGVHVKIRRENVSFNLDIIVHMQVCMVSVLHVTSALVVSVSVH
jgi:hypothetical protein